MKVFGIICLFLASAAGQNKQTTVQSLVADGRFSTLVSFVTTAGLVDTLNNGNFTIFAPTDKAFGNLDPAITTALGNDVNLLKDALLYHVIPGFVPSSAAVNELIATMANGKGARINVYTRNNVTTIQGNVISQFDLMATNGIIHVIDSVMLAPTGNIVDYVVANNATLSTLLSLVVKAGLADALKGGNLTLFAPTDTAFGKLTPAQVKDVTSDSAKLKAVLTYHVVASTQYSAGLYSMESLRTLNQNDNLVIDLQAGVKVQNAAVTKANIGVTNGVIHLIDNVLLPVQDPIVG